ncbi:MAG: hypothetical protein H8D53_01865 [Bacteroidetes bacterium]|nr:hypothetical protein [Bacteroidota bacterium]
MIKSFSKFADTLAVKKAKDSNNKKQSPTKFLQPIIKRFPKHAAELKNHINTHVELDGPSGYAQLRKDIHATLDKIGK